MDFTLGEEQTMLQDSVRRYAERDCELETRRALIARGGFDAKRWSAIAEMGWLAAGLTEEQGGFGGGLLDEAVLLEEIGRGIVPEPVLASGLLPARLLARYEDSLASLLSGEVVYAVAHGEADARGRALWVETQAERSPAGYRLDGRKTRVLGGSAAQRFLVSARFDGMADAGDGLGLFVVERGHAGLRVHDYRLVDGTPACDLEFDALELESAALLDNQAGPALIGMLEAGVVGSCAEMVGAMEQAIWIARDYLRTRKQFGVVIGSFQALQHRMADCYMALEQARSMLYRALSFIDGDADARAIAISAAKAQVGRSAQFVAAQTVQLHGGIGVTDEYVIGHYFKRLLVLEAVYGNSAFHLGVVARSLREAA